MGPVVAHRQHLQVGQLGVAEQQFFHVGAHIAGDQHVKLPLGGQDGEALLVGLPAAQRGDEADGPPLPQVQGGVTLDIQYLRAPLLGQGDDLLPEGAVRLHVGDGQSVHVYPPQELGHPVGVVVVEVGEHQQVQPPHAPVGQVVGGRVPGTVIAVPAAIHQGQEAAGAHQNALPLAHVQGGDRPGPLPEAQIAQHHGQAQGGHPGADGGDPPPLSPL